MRSVGAAAPLLPTDALQAGSQTKAVTALPARLVEQVKLRWDSTLAELFPTWRDDMHPALRDVTVTQLLRHRAGFKRHPDEADATAVLAQATGDLVTDRALLLHYLLRQAPEQAVGTFSYSNAGCMMAGLVVAHAGSWGSYYLFAILVPKQDRAIAVACNCYGPEAVEQLDRLARHLALDSR